MGYKATMRTLILPLVLVSFVAAATLPSRADTIPLITDKASTSDDWNTAADWSNGQAPGSGNDYIVTAKTLNVYVPVGGSIITTTFAGNSLTLNGGTLAYSTGTSGLSVVIN